jgi:hypothetical protein
VQILSAEKARTRLGWQPAHTLDQGLAKAIAWYRRYFAEAPGGVPSLGHEQGAVSKEP